MVDWDDFKLPAAIIMTTFAKYLMSENPVPEGETPAQTKIRTRKGIGGIIAGIIVGYFGYERVIYWVNLWANKSVLTSDDAIFVAIVLTLTGEHLFRWVMSFRSEAFTSVLRFILRVPPEDKP